MSVVAKFRVTHVTNYDGGNAAISMHPVWHANDPDHPNRKFWDATPSGHLEMNVTVPASSAFFEPGAVYTVTFGRE
jgi:hypothetical protein